MVLNIIAVLSIFVGLFLVITTTIGFIRFRNVYTQIHISTISDMVAFPLILFGIAALFYMNGNKYVAIKIGFAILVWYVVAPISSYCIIKMAYFYNKKKVN